VTPKISVVTPIYNVAQFLPKCLDSLMAQTLHDIEFICVNDGSTDNSLDILRSYSDKDDRFVVIDKPNGGYGHTMNVGIDAARGEYIGIVESDDWVDPDAFEVLYEIASANDKCDIVKANHNVFADGCEPSLVENFPRELCGRVLSPLDDDGMVVLNSIPAIWAAIYRKEFLTANGIRFLETPGASFQDTGFVYKSWIAADSFFLVHDAYLNYRVDNAGSSVKSAAKVYFVCEEFASIENFLEARSERYERLIGRILAKKFDTYNWNYDRVSEEFREEFLQRIAAEFAPAFLEDRIDPLVFKEGEFEWLCQIVEDPHKAFVADRKNRACDEVKGKLYGVADALKRRAGELAQNAASVADDHVVGRFRAHGDCKVSIVVPVYNSEKYLDKTMESLLKQTHDNFEIICVNDGSIDGSLEKLRAFERADNRVVVVDKQNEGPSVARNVGIKMATGDYLCFVDADDFVEKTMLQRLVDAAVTNAADVVIFGIDEFRDDTKRYFPMRHAVVKGKVPIGVVFDPRDVENYFENMVGFTVNKLYSMNYFKSLDLEFPSIGAHEDAPFTYVASSVSDRVYVLNAVLYHYRRERAEGSRSDDTENQYEYMLKALECMKYEFEKRGILEDYKQDFINYVVFMCRWKFKTIFGAPRQRFYDEIRNEWLASMGVLDRSGDYFYETRDRNFLRFIREKTYLEMVEMQNEQQAEELVEIYESKSFRLSEMIAAPVRLIKGVSATDEDEDELLI